MSLVRAPLTDTDSESDRERDEPSNNNNDRNVNNSNSHVPISPVAIVQASNARKRAREKSQAERERKRRKKDEAKIDKNKAKINKKSRKRKAKSNIKKVATASTTSSDSKIEKRINENPDHSLCNLDNTLYCQACCQSISTHKGNCDSHLLCDHHNRVALPNWKARRSGKTQSSISSIQRRKETLKDPSYRNKPATVDIATQHIPWGYDCYRKKPAIQKALSKDYERYLRNTRDIVDKPKYLKHWWKSNEREYKYLSVIALRCLNALRGGCDVERSFNHFSKMNRSGNAATMGPLNKEVRTMCHWNKELIANGLFDLTSL
eukprot:254204_1